jgi:hypothetical protein
VEKLAKQIDQLLRTLALPQETIESSLAELELQQQREVATWNQEIKNITAQIVAFDVKLKRLTEVYVDGTMPLSNFNLTKEKLLKLKRSSMEKLTFAQSHRKTPLEPAIRFIRGLTEARIVAEVGDATQKRDLLQKVASNLKLNNQRVLWTPRGPWKYVAETARFVRRASRAANASSSPHATFSTRCAVSCATRLPVASSLFFKDNPVWV